MNYIPSPIDTSGVRLSPELDRLTERLAENAHDIWAQKRLSEGWTSGAQKDATRKMTPFLVPYSELPDSERETDRRMVRNTLLAAIAVGVQIRPPPTPSPSPSAAEEASLSEWQRHLAIESTNTTRSCTYDMNDKPEIAASNEGPFPVLNRALVFLHEHLYPAWTNVDGLAQVHQRRHRAVAKWAIVGGGLAISLAILQLLVAASAVPFWNSLLTIGELAAALASLAAVVIGLLQRTQRNWLVCRQAAERLRSLKFSSLARPELWSDFAAWSQAVGKDIADLAALDYSRAEEWIKSGSAEPPYPKLPTCPVSVSETSALASFYRLKRQTYQRRFFTKRAAEHKEDIWLLRLRVPMILFFASVVLVMIHASLHFLAPAEHQGFPWVMCLVALAAGLPVAGFCLRAWFSAFELPRRASLFESKANQLQQAIAAVQRDEGNIEKTLYHITQGEHFFRTEHREWCRLISDAEWFI